MKSTKYPVGHQSNGKLNELWLQYLWKKNAFSVEHLFTTTGQPLNIRFPGWYNKSWGPDFKDGRIAIGDIELFGDIEIHIDEAAWFQHSHDQNEAYNKVILHVFLNKSSVQAVNNFEQTVPSLHLKSDFLKAFWENYSIQHGFNIEELPGVCGLALSERMSPKIKMIIQQAAEARLVNKSKPFMNQLRVADNKETDNLLYASICKSLGYAANSEQFVIMAQRFPYSYLKHFFRSLYRQSRVEILSRWLGYMGILESTDSQFLHENLRREWLTLTHKWHLINEDKIPQTTGKLAPFRPLNSPVRRLIGLYYHLESTHFKGLFNSWFGFLQNCQSIISDKNSKTRIISALDMMFPQPNWDPFSYFKLSQNPKPRDLATKFIGKQKQLIIMVNTIIPFFLAWSRIKNNRDLEKLIYRLLLILPNEGQNRKTRFMENRLFNGENLLKINKNLSYHQGLIQIHDDCCTSFYEGCENCSFVKWIYTPG